MIANTGWADIRKIDGDTEVTITEKGDDVSTKLLVELTAYDKVTILNKTG